ncbi:SDR family NAD(P)-dependent oxidoreductase [Streptomyces sp. W16]|uniref:SDR family NAD(P)-dependent oxidoreductase n=1 Tax=Streptomyces sp. W16 TaxID=3076631 RepID=UPI00295AF8C0|nr:SDR family NAD(P)-dependent oxidoreductase [Streptomyces sp. W16]MDV9176322.1 SDR family NAD(P)-dependent oxidoreductase [Streptomyces sp. W16]
MALIMVSGATGGIGSELVRLLRERGDEVVAVGRDAEKLKRLDARPLVLDFTDPASIEPAVREAGLDRLDAVIHAAGVIHLAGLEHATPDSWAGQLAVNLTGPAELTRVTLPALRAAHGHVVFLNFWAGPTAKPYWSAYAASKFGLKALAESLRGEEAGNGVRVTSVFPACVATPMQRAVREGFGFPYQPETLNQPDEVAGLILTALDLPANTRLNDLYLGLGPEGYPPGFAA